MIALPAFSVNAGSSSYAGVNRGSRRILLCRRSLLRPAKVSVPAPLQTPEKIQPALFVFPVNV
ncbi:hypothetical protein FH972_015054 [Carpinus fangiana]|uniref:Uncharacterized protein n=1 Tax=Carpinus fangiana TaxID=176857 RepID=A0A5N6RC62_9ROSI|nr:hypothetical protein FH972_015054 [Carpinus fangiana]